MVLGVTRTQKPAIFSHCRSWADGPAGRAWSGPCTPGRTWRLAPDFGGIQAVAHRDYPDNAAHTLPRGVKRDGLVHAGYGAERMLNLAQFKPVSLVLDLIVLASAKV